MNRLFSTILGLLVLFAGTMLLVLSFVIPSPSEVDQTTRQAEEVTDRTSTQVKTMRDQVKTVRRNEMQVKAKELNDQLPQLTAMLRDRDVDYESLSAVNKSLGEMANGVEGVSATLDTEGIGQMKTGIGKTASYLDQKVVPSAERAAERLEKVTAGIKVDIERLTKLLNEASPDLKAAREVHDSLVRLNENVERLNLLIKEERLEAMREGFKGMEMSLNSGADQVAKLAKHTYPVVTFSGLRPNIENKPFWPEGDNIADGMRKGAKGLAEAGKEFDQLAKELPKIRESLEESRKISNKTREALAKAIKEQEELEPLLKRIPKHTAALADEMLTLTTELTKILRETAQLKEVAVSLRQTEKGMALAMEKWPQLKKGLTEAATVLRTTQKHLDRALANQKKYEQTMKQTLTITDLFAALLPGYIDQLEAHLREQEEGLNNLSASIDDVRATIPVWGQTTRRIVVVVHVCLWSFAAIMFLVGGYLCATGVRRRVTDLAVVPIAVVPVTTDLVPRTDSAYTEK